MSDLIERGAALGLVARWYGACFYRTPIRLEMESDLRALPDARESVVYRQMDFEDVGWECSGCEEALWCEDGPPTEGTFGYKFCPFCGKPIERSEPAPDPYAEDEDE